MDATTARADTASGERLMDPVMMGALVGVGGLLVNALVWATGNRSNRATERDAMVQRYAAAAKWSNEWAEGLEEKVDGYRVEQEAMRGEVASLRGELEQVKGLLLRLASFVRHVLDEWVRVNPSTPPPLVWADIAHLIARVTDEAKDGD